MMDRVMFVMSHNYFRLVQKYFFVFFYINGILFFGNLPKYVNV
jgi:hypothetical protein